MDEPVTITTPTLPGMPCTSEGLRAVTRDPSAGLYEVRSVAFFTDGVSRGDIVRCERDGDQRLVAIEVVERADAVTLLLGPASEHRGPEGDCRHRRLAEDLVDRFRGSLTAELGSGVLTISFPRDLDIEVIVVIATHGRGDGVIDPVRQRLGDWYFYTVTYPDWPVPQRL